MPVPSSVTSQAAERGDASESAESRENRKRPAVVPVEGIGPGGHSYYYYSEGRQYVVTISDEDLAHCPKWDPNTQDNPPYPAAKALAQADNFMADFPVPVAHAHEIPASWALEDLALVRLGDGWAWRASYVLNRGLVAMRSSKMRCWILMDGSLMKPTATGEKNFPVNGGFF